MGRGTSPTSIKSGAEVATGYSASGMRQLPGEWTSLVRGVGRKIASCKDHSEVGTGRTGIVRGLIAPNGASKRRLCTSRPRRWRSFAGGR